MFKKIFSQNFSKYAITPVLVVLIIAAGIYFAGKNNGVKFAFIPEIKAVEDGAFGSLVSQTSQDSAVQNESSTTKESSSVAYSEFLGNLSSSAPKGLGGGGGGMSDSSQIYIPTQYKFVYAGDEFKLEDAQVQVLKRVVDSSSQSGILNFLRGLDLGIINLNSFDTNEVDYISFRENKDFGYYINVNFKEGFVEVSENWNKWDYPASRCGADERCIQDSQITIEDMLSDEEIIRIANGFIASHSIDVSSYDSGRVVNDWRLYYDQAQSEGSVGYVPEQVQVCYPLLINGEIVYDQAGNLTGIYVNINVRHRRASGIWNLKSQKYQGSNYPAITSVDDVMKIVENGGGGYYSEPGGEIIELQIGTPEKIMVLVYNYNYEIGENYELLVPALKFPILNAEEKGYYQKNIVVPLAKELADQQIPKPYPVILEQGTSSGSTTPDPALPEGAEIEVIE